MDRGGAGLHAASPDERVLVLAPIGRDATLLCQVLDRAGLAPLACADVGELIRHLSDDAGAVVLTREVLVSAAFSDLVAALSAQPPWSDVPMVLLVSEEPPVPRIAQAVASLRSVGTLTVLERPVRKFTLATAVLAALRARRRQYQMRDLIQSERAARQAAEIARQEAEAASQVKDEFLATVSHELRTPISAILLWTRLLARGGLDERKMRQGLLAVERSAEVQSQLIEDLLNASRITLGKLHLSPREVDIVPVIRAALDVIRPAAEAKRIQLDEALDPVSVGRDSAFAGPSVDVGRDSAFAGPSGAGLVRADPDRIQQVMWNLLSNAVKFTPPGGRVSIRLGRQDDRVRIEVADTGQGISQAFLPRVFERFQQADGTAQRLHGGLGIGLALSRQLVELHGGTIRASSPGEGLGATFTVELPLAGAPGPAAGLIGSSVRPGPESPALERSLEGVQVLLVEDDLGTREVMAFTLVQHGADVMAVESARAALDVLSVAGAGTRPHVLLSDLDLPGVDGYELLRRVRALGAARGDPVLPAALITAYSRTHGRMQAIEAGFAAHLSKPVEPEQLVAVVEQLARSAVAPS